MPKKAYPIFFPFIVPNVRHTWPNVWLKNQNGISTPSYEERPRQIGQLVALCWWEARPIKKMLLSKFLWPKVVFFHADSGIGLKNNFGYIPRPPEAISSFKSLFEGVPEGLQSSYFV